MCTGLPQICTVILRIRIGRLRDWQYIFAVTLGHPVYAFKNLMVLLMQSHAVQRSNGLLLLKYYLCPKRICTSSRKIRSMPTMAFIWIKICTLLFLDLPVKTITCASNILWFPGDVINLLLNVNLSVVIHARASFSY